MYYISYRSVRLVNDVEITSIVIRFFLCFILRHGVLAVEGAATDPEEDFSGEERMEQEVYDISFTAVIDKIPLGWMHTLIRNQHILPSCHLTMAG